MVRFVVALSSFDCRTTTMKSENYSKEIERKIRFAQSETLARRSSIKTFFEGGVLISNWLSDARERFNKKENYKKKKLARR